MVGQLEKTRSDLRSDLREMEFRLDKEGREFHHHDDFFRMYQAEIKNLDRILDSLVRNGVIPAGLHLPPAVLSQVLPPVLTVQYVPKSVATSGTSMTYGEEIHCIQTFPRNHLDFFSLHCIAASLQGFSAHYSFMAVSRTPTALGHGHNRGVSVLTKYTSSLSNTSVSYVKVPHFGCRAAPREIHSLALVGCLPQPTVVVSTT